MRRSLLAAVGVLLAVPTFSAADTGQGSNGTHPASCSCPGMKTASGATTAQSDPNFWANHFQTTVEVPK